VVEEPLGFVVVVDPERFAQGTSVAWRSYRGLFWSFCVLCGEAAAPVLVLAAGFAFMSGFAVVPEVAFAPGVVPFVPGVGLPPVVAEAPACPVVAGVPV